MPRLTPQAIRKSLSRMLVQALVLMMMSSCSLVFSSDDPETGNDSNDGSPAGDDGGTASIACKDREPSVAFEDNFNNAIESARTWENFWLDEGIPMDESIEFDAFQDDLVKLEATHFSTTIDYKNIGIETVVDRDLNGMEFSVRVRRSISNSVSADSIWGYGVGIYDRRVPNSAKVLVLSYRDIELVSFNNKSPEGERSQTYDQSVTTPSDWQTWNVKINDTHLIWEIEGNEIARIPNGTYVDPSNVSIGLFADGEPTNDEDRLVRFNDFELGCIE